MSIEIVFFILW